MMIIITMDAFLEYFVAIRLPAHKIGQNLEICVNI